MGRCGRGWLASAILALAGCSSQPADDVVWLVQDGRVWCYRTLADPDCLTRPEAGAEARLIAIGPRRSFVPAPAPEQGWQPEPPTTRAADGPMPLAPIERSDG